MNVGMLWHDDDPKRTLAQKVGRALAYYCDKYGHAPTTVHVHPADNLPERAAGLAVVASRAVLPNHLWIGVAE